MTHEQKCEELLEGSEFSPSPKDKERIYCVNIGADQCSILSSNNTTTSPPSSPSLDAPQPVVPASCSVLTVAEFDLEYERQHAIETVTCIENYFKQIKSRFFEEKRHRLEEAIHNIESGNDVQVQKRITSAQRCINLHIKAIECRRQVTHRCLSLVSEALRITLRHQSDVDIERLRVQGCNTKQSLPCGTIHSETSFCKSPTFRKPRKRHQPLSSSMSDSKRFNLSSDDKAVSPHASSFLSPIANQLRLETPKSKSLSACVTSERPCSDLNNAFTPDVPCMVYRLRDLDIDSDLSCLRRWRSAVYSPSNTPYSESIPKKFSAQEASYPLSTPVLIKSCRTNRNLSTPVSKKSPSITSKSLLSDSISTSHDVPSPLNDQSDQKLSFKTKQLLKQKLSPRCLAVSSQCSLTVSSPIQLQASRHNTPFSRVVIDTECVPPLHLPILSPLETSVAQPRLLSQYTHPQNQDPLNVQKSTASVTRVFPQNHRPAFNSHLVTEIQSPSKSSNESSIWTLPNSFSPARDPGSNLSSSPSWPQQCDLSNITSMTNAVTLPQPVMLNERFSNQ